MSLLRLVMFSFATRSSPRLLSTLRHSTRSLDSRPNFGTLQSKMAQPTPTSQIISQTAKQEGGPEKGSAAAQMQSEVGKTRNFEQAAQEIIRKMQQTPEAITKEDAAYLKSREARAIGTNNPPAGSVSADAEHLAAENIVATKDSSNAGAGGVNPAHQSAQTKVHNYEQAASEVGSKMQNAPGSVTEADAAYLHSREARASGQANPPPGSLSAQAEHLAAVNEGHATAQASAGGENNDPASQSAKDRLRNLEEATSQVGQKMARDPEHVTKDDANLLHSREERAFGETEKGGISAQAQSMAAQNEGKSS
ncbi:hypothetical protein D0862_07763 [Hortaea werneckii]|uniref:SMP domain-containing protein n=1 Tax=Hortaea werneckii TaxID=91943 RepID=A0A3M7GAA0_HORWE|nr:hypothetical protein D0862_07763 [Hortaea werneckii]